MSSTNSEYDMSLSSRGPGFGCGQGMHRDDCHGQGSVGGSACGSYTACLIAADQVKRNCNAATSCLHQSVIPRAALRLLLNSLSRNLLDPDPDL